VDLIALRKKTLSEVAKVTRDVELGKAISSLLVLQDRPANEDANLAVGKYYCFQKED
jgi:hypothetical protein